MRVPFALALAFLLTGCPVPPRVHPRAAEEVSRGYRFLSAGDAERAEIAFRHSLAFDPDFPEGENGLGLVARTRGDLAAARRAFERAISLRTDFAEAHANLGELLLADGDADEAERRLRAALEIDPDLADARQNLARLLLWRGLEPGRDRKACFAASRRELLHLLEADPDRAAAHHDLGLIDYLEGNYPRAEASYRRATELAPGFAEAHHGLCLSLVRLGRCDEAVASCARCLEVNPELGECRKSIAGARACDPGGSTPASAGAAAPTQSGRGRASGRRTRGPPDHRAIPRLESGEQEKVSG